MLFRSIALRSAGPYTIESSSSLIWERADSIRGASGGESWESAGGGVWIYIVWIRYSNLSPDDSHSLLLS